MGDPTAFGRNFFMADSNSEVDEKEREQILVEATMLKGLATNYQHPEVKVDFSDATLFGRNYFNRFDGSEVVEEDAEERVQILADAAALKKEAVYYNSPEAPVHVDPTVFGKNFFTADSNSEVDEKEREQILVEATMLKELATNYQHPEVKVKT